MDFALLGPLEARLHGRSLPLGGVRSQLVLACLLLHRGATVTVHELADLAWDGNPPPTARKQIQTVVYQLRRLFAAAPELLHTDSAGYRLVLGSDQLDVDRFSEMVLDARARTSRGDLGGAVEQFRTALGLWRGRPLAGLPGRTVERHATHLEELRLTAVEECAEIELRLGRHRQLIPELRALADALPLRERLTGLLMSALAGDGRQAEAISAFHERAATLREELGVDPGPMLHAVYVETLLGAAQAASVAAAPSPATPAALPTEPVAAADDHAATLIEPAQLPTDVSGFAGRKEAIALLDQLAARVGKERGTVVVVALAGSAGVGKTALAVHWAHRVAHRFPDGQLYVNLRGYGPSDAITPSDEAARVLLDGLGVSAQRMPTGLDARTSLYRSIMTGRRMLILLDNARDAAQVRPLLPASSGCLVLVTSRSDLAGLVVGEGAVPLPIDVLSHDEACNLLRKRLGAARIEREPAAVEEIVDRCARLPLALAIAAARAAIDPRRSLGDIARTLAEAEGHLDPFAGPDTTTDIRAVFSWSYQLLRPAAARLFRLLGLHPGNDISVAVAASLTGTPPNQVVAALAELVSVHLLTEVRTGRYSFHDLLRAFAREQIAADPDAREGLRRLLDHYLHTAASAARQLDASRRTIPLPAPAPGVVPETITGQDHAMVWFGAEYRALVTGVSLAAGSDDAGLALHPARLARTLTDYQKRTGRWDDALAGHRTAEVAARQRGDRLGEGLALHGLTRAQTYLGDADSARDAGMRAVAIFRDAGLHLAEADVHRSIIVALARVDRHGEALAHAERQAELYAEHGDAADRANSLNTYGLTLTDTGRYDEALDPLNRALKIQYELDDDYAAAFIHDSLGRVYLGLDQLQDAELHYRRSLALFDQEGDRYAMVYPLSGLGDVCAAHSDAAGARALYERALVLCREVGQHHWTLRLSERLRRREEQPS
ncbi:BTAD domain-containing putative transcriptional regulator [Micromonospora sp. NPDC005710]|uniref:AfsR/SARP family transcriptional regulator n=1 Tax=Micromonospora sp. NPDC005710 TaxID=3157051 RepID=UPI0033D50EE1